MSRPVFACVALVAVVAALLIVAATRQTGEGISFQLTRDGEECSKGCQYWRAHPKLAACVEAGLYQSGLKWNKLKYSDGTVPSYCEGK